MKRKYFIKGIEAIVIAIIMAVTVVPQSVFGKEKMGNPESDNISYTIHFFEPNLKKSEIMNQNFTKISMYDCIDWGQGEGAPSLPVHPVKILIPYKKEIESLNVYGEKVELNSKIDLKTIPVMPHQNPVPIGEKVQPKLVMDHAIYNSTSELPSNIYSSLGVDYCRGYAILTLNLYPVKYIPREGKIFYYPNITIEINLKNTGYVNRFYRNNIDDKEYVKKLVINPDVADTYKGRANFGYPGGICDPSDNGGLGYKYVIITTELNNETTGTYTWNDLIAKKEAEGLTATKVTVEQIVACSDYWNTTDSLFNDTPAKIREFCRDAYLDWGTEYVLIGGDNDAGEPWTVQRRLLSYSYETNVDSDLYWSNLDKTFNADHDSLWGEEGDGGFDLYSELYIGSVPCHDGADISNWITKDFYYDDSLEKDYLDNAAFYGGNTGWPCEGDDFIDYSARLGTDNWLGPSPGAHGQYPSWLGFQYGFETWNLENPGMEYNITQAHTAEPPNDGWIGDGISGMRNAINNDECTLISAVAHADEHMSMDVDDSDWATLYHNTKPFFVTDYGCHCGDIDACSEGVVNVMLFNSNTELAFACMYHTSYGWGSLEDTNSSSALLQKCFWDYMFNTSKSGGSLNWQLGRAVAYAKDEMAPTINWTYSGAPGSWRCAIEAFLLFGDPALGIKPPLLPEHNIGVKSIDVPDHVNPGELVYINATLVNNGRNNETNVVVSCRINGTEIGNVTIPFFEKQTFQEVSFSWTPAKGWYTVTINETIPGVTENITYDNEKSELVVAGPDVAVLSMNAPQTAILNSMRQVRANIKNLGAEDEVVNVNLRENGTIVDTVQVFVASKRTQSITLLWNPSAEGIRSLEIEANVSGEVYPGNNYRSQDVNVVSPQGFVLLVDDDGGSNYETYFENAIVSAGYAYEYWDRSNGCPSADYMASHMAVIWFTGSMSSTLTSEDEAALSTYLDNGGRLFITGEDIGYSIHSHTFYSNYLHAQYLTDDTNINYLDGIAGDPIGNNLTICIVGGDGANNQNWPDGISPINGATSVFQYQSSSYYGGIKYSGTYKVVYFGFGFEAINNGGDRTGVMGRILSWFGNVTSNVPDIWMNPMNLYYVTPSNSTINDEFTIGNDANATANLTFNISLPHGFSLQWMHSHGGDGDSQFAQPVGDFDGDGVNEFLFGGYGCGGCYMYSYNKTLEEYQQEYFWTYPGGWYNAPSGSAVGDFNKDGILDFSVSWEYSGQNGIHVYDWDGTNLTQLDYYNSVGYDFAYDVYACDYDDDGTVELLIANNPPSASGYHVTALGWNNATNSFEREISWGSGQATECPMVWSGDTDGDGKTEVVACAGTNTVYALNYESGTWVPDIVASGLSAHPYGVACGDLDGDGIDEIGFGLHSTDAYIYKWNSSTSSYQQVWHYNYAGEDDIIEGIAIGDVDGDGQPEFLVGPTHVHVIKWNGTGYYEAYTITDTQGMLAGVVVGDFDSDGLNEVKACDILSGIGKEWIEKYHPEPSWITITPRSGTLAPGEQENISISIDTTNFTTGVTSLFLGVNTNDPDESSVKMPLYISVPSFVTKEIALQTGWNFITIPVDLKLNASALYSMISGCSMILKWNNSKNDFDVYVPGSPNNFAIENGIGYFISVNNNTNLSVTGMLIGNVNILLAIGWNSLGWFNPEQTNASNIYNSIAGCNIVLRWNNSKNDFDVYVPGAPDFVIEQGNGFFVSVNQQSQWHGS